MVTSIRTVNAEGNIRWELPDGTLHREDGPALETVLGTKAWYQHGIPHRVDGPAVEWADGTKQWWLNGRIQPNPVS